MLEALIKAQEVIENEKERILDYICQDYSGYKNQEKFKMERGKLHFANFSDITDSWSVKDIHTSIVIRTLGGKKTNQTFEEIESIIFNVKKSKDLILTLSKMLQFKNCSDTRARGRYFVKIDEDTLDRISEVLLDEFIPTYSYTNINGKSAIKDKSALVIKREEEVKEVYKRIAIAKNKV